jgi:hypothetical protein
MKAYAAERKLLVARKGSKTRTELSIKVGLPYIVSKESVAFKVDDETAACEIDIIGLSKPFNEIAYGADLLQALQLSADIEPVLKSLSSKYDFYFLNGDTYFE